MSDDRFVEELAARCRFPTRGHHVLGVSGGADSMAMLLLARAAGLEVTAVHVDHGLRPGGPSEAALVRRMAARLGAGFDRVTVTVGDGPNLEARARDARHAALGERALLAHTADDQAETVLLQLLRGAGPEGLAGIRPERRPLLGLRRWETVEVCRRLDVPVVEDPSNTDPRHRRNRIRHEALPLLCDVAGRDVVPLLARAADHQREVVEVLAASAAAIDPTDAAALAAAPAGTAAVALRRWWRDETGSAYAPDSAATARMMAVARGVHRATEVTGGWRLSRHGGRLRLTAPYGRRPTSR